MSQSVYVLSNGLKPQEDLVISALRTVIDPDGISVTPNYTFAWERSAERTDNPAAWHRISGATASTYTPGDADVGYLLRAVLGYVDGANNTESVLVVTDEAVANVNDRPTHNLRLVGNFTENGVISVGVQAGITDPARILDADNVASVPAGLVPLETVRFSWFADNVLLASELRRCNSRKTKWASGWKCACRTPMPAVPKNRFRLPPHRSSPTSTMRQPVKC